MKRAKSLHGDGSNALTPALDTASPAVSADAELKWLKQLLASERRRHGQVENILTRQITQLERQVSDLRRLYFSTISVPTSPLEKKNDHQQ